MATWRDPKPWEMSEDQLQEMLEQAPNDYLEEDEFAVPEDYDRNEQ